LVGAGMKSGIDRRVATDPNSIQPIDPQYAAAQSRSAVPGNKKFHDPADLLVRDSEIQAILIRHHV
jgi:hypothetical protein